MCVSHCCSRKGRSEMVNNKGQQEGEIKRLYEKKKRRFEKKKEIRRKRRDFVCNETLPKSQRCTCAQMEPHCGKKKRVEKRKRQVRSRSSEKIVFHSRSKQRALLDESCASQKFTLRDKWEEEHRSCVPFLHMCFGGATLQSRKVQATQSCPLSCKLWYYTRCTSLPSRSDERHTHTRSFLLSLEITRRRTEGRRSSKGLVNLRGER